VHLVLLAFTIGSLAGMEPGDELVIFLIDGVRRVRAQLGEDCTITIPGDAGLWTSKVRNWLREHRVPFAMAMPLAPSVKLYARVAACSAVNEDPDIEAAVLLLVDLWAFYDRQLTHRGPERAAKVAAA